MEVIEPSVVEDVVVVSVAVVLVVVVVSSTTTETLSHTSHTDGHATITVAVSFQRTVTNV